MKTGQDKKLTEVITYKSFHELLEPLENRIKTLEDKSDMTEYINDGETIKEKFSRYVCMINGSGGVGAGVILDGINIVTVKHLGFKVGEFCDVKLASGDVCKAQCIWISSSIDLATLRLNGNPTADIPVDELASGRTYYGFGIPHSSEQDSFSVTKIFIEGLYSDKTHFNGVPGARGGFSGGPVFSKFGRCCGLMVGTVHDVGGGTTILNMMEQPAVRILPMTTINSEIKKARLGGVSNGYVAPKELWLDSSNGKGLQIEGTFARINGTIFMKMVFTNKVTQPLSDFAVQFNTNSFGLTPAGPLNFVAIWPDQSANIEIPCLTNGEPRMTDPLTSLQVAVKDNLGVICFAVVVPLHMYFDDNGHINECDFLQLWQQIPEQNYTFQNTMNFSADDICTKLQQNNIFTVARRNVEGQELLYHSIKYTNNIFILSELKMQQNSPAINLSLKSRESTAIANLNEIYQTILSQ